MKHTSRNGYHRQCSTPGQVRVIGNIREKAIKLSTELHYYPKDEKTNMIEVAISASIYGLKEELKSCGGPNNGTVKF